MQLESVVQYLDSEASARDWLKSLGVSNAQQAHRNLVAIADAGATAVIQPGGSVRDDEVIAAADDAGLAMVFTGMRHFRH